MKILCLMLGHKLRYNDTTKGIVCTRRGCDFISEKVVWPKPPPSKNRLLFVDRKQIKRILKVKYFIGSTTEEIEAAELLFLSEKDMCPGNFVYEKLYKYGSVYQKVLYYAEMEELNG